MSACEIFLEKDVFDRVKELYDCYDEDNESSSVIPEKIKALDDEIIACDFVSSAKKNAADYIKKNVTQFV